MSIQLNMMLSIELMQEMAPSSVMCSNLFPSIIVYHL